MNRFNRFLNERRILDFVEHLTTLDDDELDTVLESIDSHSLQMVLATLNESNRARKKDTRSLLARELAKRFPPPEGSRMTSDAMALIDADFQSPAMRSSLRHPKNVTPVEQDFVIRQRAQSVRRARNEQARKLADRRSAGQSETRRPAGKRSAANMELLGRLTTSQARELYKDRLMDKYIRDKWHGRSSE